jgi:hypothetical protein
MWMHGPAIRIENGKVIQSHHEKKLSSPGVILLDTASAAMLRTKTTFVRAVGPGVIFTDGGEFLHQEAVDLHTQVRPLPPLGPLGNEDPYAHWNKKKEEEKEFQARQNRRKETSGLTRDGVEIVPNILAVVKTKSLAGQGGTRFGFNSKAVSLAITREGIVPDGLRNVPWFEIPAYLAVELWREYLSKFTLTELFISPDEESSLISKSVATGKKNLETGLQLKTAYRRGQQDPETRQRTRFEIILRMIKLRLTQAQVPLLDDYGRETDETQDSREYQILEEMGIQVIDVSISNPRFPRTVESQLVQQWLSTWLERAIAEREAIENRRALAGEKGEDSALLKFAEEVVHNIHEAIVDDDGNLLPTWNQLLPNREESLEKLVAGTQQLLTRNPNLHHWLLDEEAELERLLEWIRRE